MSLSPNPNGSSIISIFSRSQARYDGLHLTHSQLWPPFSALFELDILQHDTISQLTQRSASSVWIIPGHDGGRINNNILDATKIKVKHNSYDISAIDSSTQVTPVAKSLPITCGLLRSDMGVIQPFLPSSQLCYVQNASCFMLYPTLVVDALFRVSRGIDDRVSGKHCYRPSGGRAAGNPRRSFRPLHGSPIEHTKRNKRKG